MEKNALKISDLRGTKTFNVEKGDNIVISDPCYDLAEMANSLGTEIKGCCGYKLKAKPGTWTYKLNEDNNSLVLDVYEINSYDVVKKEEYKMGLDFGELEEYEEACCWLACEENADKELIDYGYDFNFDEEFYEYFTNGRDGDKEEKYQIRVFDSSFRAPVDSGQIGVFLEKSYQKDSLLEDVQFENEEFNSVDEKWYRACCEISCSDSGLGFVPYGFVAHTKYGDGSYLVGLRYTEEEINYIRIILG